VSIPHPLPAPDPEPSQIRLITTSLILVTLQHVEAPGQEPGLQHRTAYTDRLNSNVVTSDSPQYMSSILSREYRDPDWPVSERMQPVCDVKRHIMQRIREQTPVPLREGFCLAASLAAWISFSHTHARALAKPMARAHAKLRSRAPACSHLPAQGSACPRSPHRAAWLPPLQLHVPSRSGQAAS